MGSGQRRVRPDSKVREDRGVRWRGIDIGHPPLAWPRWDDPFISCPTCSSTGPTRFCVSAPRLDSPTSASLDDDNDDDLLLDPTSCQRSLLPGLDSGSLQLGLFPFQALLERLVVIVQFDLFLLGRLEGFEL